MIATYVSPRLTPMTFDQAARAMRAALRHDLGAPPSLEILALALAKCALETGRFQAIWNWNWGNIKASATYEGMFTCIALNEVLAGRVVWFAPEGQLTRKGGALIGAPMAVPPGHPQTRMRAHANEFDGAFEYTEFMRFDKNGNTRAMWSALKLAEPVAFVHAMKVAGYFTADEATYAKAVASLFKEYRLKLEGKNPEPTALPLERDPEWRSLMACAADLRASNARDLIEAEAHE